MPPPPAPTPTPPVPGTPPPVANPTPPVPGVQPIPPPLPLRIVRAAKIQADRITAKVLYARRLDAKTGTIETIAAPLPGLEEQLADDELRMNVLDADIIYAGEVQADSVAIAASHVEDLRVKKLNGDGPGPN
jgi:hypothetical protein